MPLEFEGETVDVMKVVVHGSRHIVDVPLLVDEDVTLQIDCHIAGVTHRLQPGTGIMERLHDVVISDVRVTDETT